MRTRRIVLSLIVTLVLGAAACVPEETSIDMERGPGEVEDRGHREEDVEGEEASEVFDEGEELGDREEPEDEAGTEERGVEEEAEESSEVIEELAEEGEEELPVSFDLDCSDEAGVCKFCGPPVEVTASCPEDDDSFECQVFRLVNEERVSRGLSELGYDVKLAESAQMHAMDLSLCDYFAHDSLDGTSFFERCASNGYEGTCTGENIGGGQETPQSVFDAWMASPSHRENILYPYHEEMGVALYVGDGGYGRYWVKHFGRP